MTVMACRLCGSECQDEPCIDGNPDSHEPSQKCPDCVDGLQPSTHVDDEQPMRLCSTCDGSGFLEQEVA